MEHTIYAWRTPCQAQLRLEWVSLAVIPGMPLLLAMDPGVPIAPARERHASTQN